MGRAYGCIALGIGERVILNGQVRAGTPNSARGITRGTVDRVVVVSIGPVTDLLWLMEATPLECRPRGSWCVHTKYRQILLRTYLFYAVSIHIRQGPCLEARKHDIA
jgi:hypothetical protein